MTLTQQKLRCRQGFRSLSERRVTTPSTLGPRADRAISLAAAVVAAHGVLGLVGWRAGSVAAWTVAVVSLVDLGFPAWLDHVLGGATGQFGPVQLGVMSPITAGGGAAGAPGA